MQLRKAARLILVGAPGVGKGTQTERMLNRYPQLSSISSGDLLRENVRQRTPLGKGVRPRRRNKSGPHADQLRAKASKPNTLCLRGH